MILVVSLVSASPPVHYVENKNQWPDAFRFGADFPQARVLLKDASIYFVHLQQLPDDEKSPKKLKTDFSEAHDHASGTVAMSTFELVFLNALKPTIEPSDKQKTIYNYYLGNDESKWASAAAAYGYVTYKEMYRGIDLKIYSEDDHVKYDWIVSPCADPGKIRFSYKGIQDLDLREENLVITSKLGEVVETKPFAYQVVNGERRQVMAAFEIDNGEVYFVFPKGYDTNYELVIDPFLIFSSYSGSTLDNWGNTATPDSRGNLYSGGMVSTAVTGSSFPTTAGAYQVTHKGGSWDVGILKYDSVGANLLYVTYLGGNGVETPQSLVVNSQDELLILGATSSSNFPGTIPADFKGGSAIDPLNGVDYAAGTDLFVSRLSVTGSQLIASTYLGGTSNDGINFISGDMGSNNKVESPLARNYGDQLRGDIITDTQGFIYIASNTQSDDFPVLNDDLAARYHGGSHDGVVAKLDPQLNLVWSRMMGGSGTDVVLSIKIAASGNILVGGGTTSIDMPGMNGLHSIAPGGTDGWIAEIASSGEQIINATYIGTPSYDQVYFIDIGTTGDVFAYGQTQGDYPIAPLGKVYANPSSGQFLHRLKADLKATVFSTTFGKGGKTPDISPTAFLVNACDNIYMAGWGGSINLPNRGDGINRIYVGGNTFGLPFTADAWQKQTLGNDFYLMVLTGDASQLVYATFLGGASSLTHVDGGTSRFDKRGIVYHAVCASCGGRTNDFPSYNVPAARSQNRSSNCNNAAFKFDLSSLRAGIQTNNVKLTSPGFNKVCIPDGIMFENLSIGGELFEWDFGDGQKLTVISKVPIPHYYAKPGKYTVWLKSIDRSTCIGEDSTSTLVEAFIPNMGAGADQKICFGSSTRLSAFGGAKYEWKTSDGKFTSGEANPSIAPSILTNYYLTTTDIGGCIKKDTVVVDVVPGVELAFDYERFYDCNTRPYVKVKNLSELKDSEEMRFLFGDGTSSGEIEAVHNYDKDGIYTIALQATKEFCVYQVSEELRFVTLRIPNVITPGNGDGLNESFKIVYGTPPVVKDGLPIALKIVDRWGVSVYETDDYQDDWNGSNVDEGIYYYQVDITGEVQCRGWLHVVK
jgi:hypothetical protein